MCGCVCVLDVSTARGAERVQPLMFSVNVKVRPAAGEPHQNQNTVTSSAFSASPLFSSHSPHLSFSSVPLSHLLRALLCFTPLILCSTSSLIFTPLTTFSHFLFLHLSSVSSSTLPPLYHSLSLPPPSL